MRAPIAAVALAVTPFAATAASVGPQVGIRGAFALPVGDIDGGTSFSDLFTGFIPLSAEIGYRFAPNFYAGILGGYGFAITKNCAAGLDCSGHTVGLGLELQIHFASAHPLDPWIGLTAGYEWLSATAAQAGQSITARANGLQFAGLELGVELGTGPVRFGPFVSASVGQYTNEEGESGGTTQPVAFDQALHGFVNFGLRVSFGP
jgi:hypothetical protein